jgi:hypothetical protein
MKIRGSQSGCRDSVLERHRGFRHSPFDSADLTGRYYDNAVPFQDSSSQPSRRVPSAALKAANYHVYYNNRTTGPAYAVLHRSHVLEKTAPARCSVTALGLRPCSLGAFGLR